MSLSDLQAQIAKLQAQINAALTPNQPQLGRAFLALNAPFQDGSQLLPKGQSTQLLAQPVVIAGTLNPDGTITNKQGTIPISGTVNFSDQSIVIDAPDDSSVLQRIASEPLTTNDITLRATQQTLLVTARLLMKNSTYTTFLETPLDDASGRLSNHSFDRNPKDADQGYAATGVAPHALATRWTYTVPANRKALVSSIRVFLARATVAAPVGISLAAVRRTPSGGSVITICQAQIGETNNAGDKDSLYGAANVYALAGDTIDGVTRDLSTGGTIDYMVNASIMEFDA